MNPELNQSSQRSICSNTFLWFPSKGQPNTGKTDRMSNTRETPVASEQSKVSRASVFENWDTAWTSRVRVSPISESPLCFSTTALRRCSYSRRVLCFAWILNVSAVHQTAQCLPSKLYCYRWTVFGVVITSRIDILLIVLPRQKYLSWIAVEIVQRSANFIARFCYGSWLLFRVRNTSNSLDWEILCEVSTPRKPLLSLFYFTKLEGTFSSLSAHHRRITSHITSQIINHMRITPRWSAWGFVVNLEFVDEWRGGQPDERFPTCYKSTAIYTYQWNLGGHLALKLQY